MVHHKVNLVSHRDTNGPSKAILKFTPCSCQYGRETWFVKLRDEQRESEDIRE